jgi:hypothetical protein
MHALAPRFDQLSSARSWSDQVVRPLVAWIETQSCNLVFFFMPTEVCTYYYQNERSYPPQTLNPKH